MALLTWGAEPLTWGGVPVSWGPYSEPGGPVLVAEQAPLVDWLWSAGPGASSSSPGPVADLVSARGRTITWRYRGHAFAQFTIDARADDAAAIVPRVSDVWAYRDSTEMFRGRVIAAIPQLGPNQHLWNVTAVDYRGMLSLAAKVEPPAPIYSGVDQGAIVWDLIDRWQTLPGGDWGIVNGDGATSGTLRDETDITPGAPVGEVIDRLADRENGFEWEITPGLVLNRFYPRRERDLGVVLDYGGTVVELSATAASFANVVVASGDEGTVPTVATGPSLTGTGRWTSAVAFTSVRRQDTLDSKAVFAVEQAARQLDSWNVTLAPGAWAGQDGMWLGDTVRLEVADGSLAISGPRRVTEIQVSCGDHGTETVRVAVEGV